MTKDELRHIGRELDEFLGRFRHLFAYAPTRENFRLYVRGLMSDLPRKSVEPIALAAGSTVRTVQCFLTNHRWDAGAVRDELQRQIAQRHLPAPGNPAAADPVGLVGWTDETSVPKKGDKTPGVQRQYCGATGKKDNCVVTVHLACCRRGFMALLDSDLFVPEKSWSSDARRRAEAHFPPEVVYRSKWQIALAQLDRSRGNGISLDWMVFDEYYGSKPGYLLGLQSRGQKFVGEVPCNFYCFSSRPRYQSTRATFAPKWAGRIVRHGKSFRGRPWRAVRLVRKTLPDEVWWYKAGRVHVDQEGRCTPETFWLIWARNPATSEDKYFISNAPPHTPVELLLRVAFTRAGVEHTFRILKTEIGFHHFEGRSYVGLMRHMVLCQTVFLFAAAYTDRIKKKMTRLPWSR